jgi:hypothetical protein
LGHVSWHNHQLGISSLPFGLGHDQIAQEKLAKDHKHNERGVQLTSFLEFVYLRGELFIQFMLVVAHYFELQGHKLGPGLEALFEFFEL